MTTVQNMMYRVLVTPIDTLQSIKIKKDSVYRRFWYHVLIWVSFKFRRSAKVPLSATLRYFWHKNFRSKTASCVCVKVVRLRRGRLGLIGSVAGRGASVCPTSSVVCFDVKVMFREQIGLGMAKRSCLGLTVTIVGRKILMQRPIEPPKTVKKI